MHDSEQEHSAIIEQYKSDFTQYEEENHKLLITHIYELIPAELNEKNRRFMIVDSFRWLWKIFLRQNIDTAIISCYTVSRF